MPERHDAAAIEELLRHRAWALRLARGLVRDESSADDVVQDSFLAAFQRPPASLDAPRAWLARVVRSWAARGARSHGRRERRERAAVVRPDAEPAGDVVARADLHRFLADAVMRLDEPYRTSLLLRYFDGLSQRQVAARTGAGLETTRTRLRRGLAILRSRLEERARREGADWRASLLLLLDGSAATRRGSLRASAAAAALAAAGVVALRADASSEAPADPTSEHTAAAAVANPTPRGTTRAVSARARVISANAEPGGRDDPIPEASVVVPADAAPARRPAAVFGAEAPWVDPSILVTSVAFLPGGDVLASGASDGTVRLRSVPDGRTLRILRGHEGGAACVAAPSARLVLSGGEDGAVRAWDPETGAALAVHAFHDAPVREIACGAQGLAASSDTAGGIVVWRVRDGSVLARLCVPDGFAYARSLAMSPDGRTLAAATTKLEGLLTWTIDGDRVSANAALAGRGRVCRFGAGGAAVWCATAESLELAAPAGEPVARVTGVAAEVTALDRVDGVLVAGTRDGRVRVWRGGEEAFDATLPAPVMALALRQAGDLAACATSAGAIELVDLATGALRTPRPDEETSHRRAVSSVAVDPCGRFAATGSWDGTVKLWDLATRRALRTLRGHGDWVVAVDVSSDGRLVASASHDRTVRVWDAATGDARLVLEGHRDIVAAVRFDPDGAFLLSGGRDADAVLWNLRSGEAVRRFRGHREQVRGVAFLPRGRVVTASEDRTLRIWSRETGAVIRTLEGHADRVVAVDTTADGSRIVSGSHDGTLRVWDAETGAELAVLRGHRGWIHAVAASRDGRFAVSAGHDGTARRWDLVTGDALDVLAGHDAAVGGVAFLRDGRALTAGWDKRVLEWDAPGAPK